MGAPFPIGRVGIVTAPCSTVSLIVEKRILYTVDVSKEELMDRNIEILDLHFASVMPLDTRTAMAWAIIRAKLVEPPAACAAQITIVTSPCIERL
jgi:hypothetical protein